MGEAGAPPHAHGGTGFSGWALHFLSKPRAARAMMLMGAYPGLPGLQNLIQHQRFGGPTRSFALVSKLRPEQGHGEA